MNLYVPSHVDKYLRAIHTTSLTYITLEVSFCEHKCLHQLSSSLRQASLIVPIHQCFFLKKKERKRTRLDKKKTKKKLVNQTYWPPLISENSDAFDAKGNELKNKNTTHRRGNCNMTHFLVWNCSETFRSDLLAETPKNFGSYKTHLCIR